MCEKESGLQRKLQPVLLTFIHDKYSADYRDPLKARKLYFAVLDFCDTYALAAS